MDRDPPPIQLRPYRNRRDERAMRARDTRNKTIPDLLRSCARAKHGIAKAELILDPPPVVETPQNGVEVYPPFDFKIRVNQFDTLSAASRISETLSATTRPTTESKDHQSPTVAVLNMASAVWPGGSFLDGGNRQEEYLCARTTLYPSLWNGWYPLPEISGIYTPDVLVFRDNLNDGKDLPKTDRYFIDVISSSMPRFSDSRGDGCTCGVSYCDRHRDIVLRKMKAVMRIAQSKGVKKLVLGAWGCGKLGNPVKEIAKCWRKVIAGGPRQRRPNAERWDGIKEIYFAIPDRDMRHEFELAFKDILANNAASPSQTDDDSVYPDAQVSEEQARSSELLTRMAEIELRLDQTQNVRLRNTYRQMLNDLQRELQQGSTRISNEEEMDTEAADDDIVEDDYVLTNLPIASDQEDGTSYALSSTSSPSFSPRRPHGDAEPYEFRPAAPGLLDSHPSHETEEEEEESQDEHLLHPPLPRRRHPPQFDPATGWVQWQRGRFDGIFARNGEVEDGWESGESEESGGCEAGEWGLGGLDPEALRGYLGRYEGSDVLDY